jgi:hypothetical protein
VHDCDGWIFLLAVETLVITCTNVKATEVRFVNFQSILEHSGSAITFRDCPTFSVVDLPRLAFFNDLTSLQPLSDQLNSSSTSR